MINNIFELDEKQNKIYLNQHNDEINNISCELYGIKVKDLNCVQLINFAQVISLLYRQELHILYNRDKTDSVSIPTAA